MDLTGLVESGQTDIITFDVTPPHKVPAMDGAERTHQCWVCFKSFFMSSNLVEHLRTHTSEKPHICPVCTRAFAQKSNLTKHMRFHIGLQPFTCMFCSKKFTQTADLIVHTRSHTGERPYACTICGKAFAHKSNLNKHVNRTHKDDQIIAPVQPPAFNMEIPMFQMNYINEAILDQPFEDAGLLLDFGVNDDAESDPDFADKLLDELLGTTG